jgi:hypothetical protein
LPAGLDIQESFGQVGFVFGEIACDGNFWDAVILFMAVVIHRQLS